MGETNMSDTIAKKLRGWIVAVAILCMALALIFFLSDKWTTWASEGEEQKTDDANLRAGLRPARRDPGLRARHRTDLPPARREAMGRIGDLLHRGWRPGMLQFVSARFSGL